MPDFDAQNPSLTNLIPTTQRTNLAEVRATAQISCLTRSALSRSSKHTLTVYIRTSLTRDDILDVPKLAAPFDEKIDGFWPV